MSIQDKILGYRFIAVLANVVNGILIIWFVAFGYYMAAYVGVVFIAASLFCLMKSYQLERK